MAWRRYEARLSPRPRHEVPPAVLFALRPLFRYSRGRHAWVLRWVGSERGPVLRRRPHQRRGTPESTSPLPAAPVTGSAPARQAVLPSRPGVDSRRPPQRPGRTASASSRVFGSGMPTTNYSRRIERISHRVTDEILGLAYRAADLNVADDGGSHFIVKDRKIVTPRQQSTRTPPVRPRPSRPPQRSSRPLRKAQGSERASPWSKAFPGALTFPIGWRHRRALACELTVPPTTPRLPRDEPRAARLWGRRWQDPNRAGDSFRRGVRRSGARSPDRGIG